MLRTFAFLGRLPLLPLAIPIVMPSSNSSGRPSLTTDPRHLGRHNHSQSTSPRLLPPMTMFSSGETPNGPLSNARTMDPSKSSVDRRNTFSSTETPSQIASPSTGSSRPTCPCLPLLTLQARYNTFYSMVLTPSSPRGNAPPHNPCNLCRVFLPQPRTLPHPQQHSLLHCNNSHLTFYLHSSMLSQLPLASISTTPTAPCIRRPLHLGRPLQRCLRTAWPPVRDGW